MAVGLGVNRVEGLGFGVEVPGCGLSDWIHRWHID